MKTTHISLTAVALSLAFLPALAGDKANSNAPGQDRVCLVTTGTADSWNDVDVVATKWPPRKAADAQASKNPSMMRVFDYTSDALVLDGTYASAEELCNTHFKK